MNSCIDKQDGIIYLHEYKVKTKKSSYAKRFDDFNFINDIIDKRIQEKFNEQYSKNIILLLETMRLKEQNNGNDNIVKCNNKCLSEKEELKVVIEQFTEENKILKKELTKMGKINQNIIHYPSIFFMIASSMVFMFFAMSIYLGISKLLWLVHPYYTVTGVIASLGMFLTSYSGFEKWREKIIGHK